jgi:L-threonylcarbamoyladenylate synthase
LTLVLPRTDAVPLLVTAGQPTVALRVPAHPLTLSVLEQVGVPLAAPSANRSTELSPTTAEHVLRSLGPDTWVLDGGPSRRGLESTVVRVVDGTIEVLRWGSLAADGLATVAPVRFVTETHGTPSPGMQLRHYAPRTPLELANDPTGHGGSDAALVTLRPSPHAGQFAHAVVLSPSGDLAEAAARLFDVLHALGHLPGIRRIVAVPVPETGLGLAINDRLRRGAHR